MDKQINQPQDIIIPQSESNKSAEEESKLKCMDCCHEFYYNKLVTVKRKQQCPECGSVHYDFIDQEFKKKGMYEIRISIMQSRITQLENQLQQSEPYITEIGMDNAKLKRQNKELREALELICLDYEERGKTYADAYVIGKQALNPKDNV